jgi:hypothetical protein
MMTSSFVTRARETLTSSTVTVMAFCLLLCSVTLPIAQAACLGDCNGDGEVTVDDILIGVNIALGLRPLDDCPVFDDNADEEVTVDELLRAVNNALSQCPIEPIFPANYRDTFIEVRNCRFGIEHGGVNVRVLANSIAAEPYLQEQNPLPVGSIIVKEEYAGTDCNDDSELVQWRAMRKESPGFDPEDGDWHWQWVDLDRSVRFDDKSTCISCHRQPECLERDYMCTVEDERGSLRRVFDGLPSALLAISGTSSHDVFAVGSDKGDGPAVLHYDGQRWTQLPTGVRGDLWWVSQPPIDGDFYMAGSDGLILQYDPDTGTFHKHSTPGNELIYGIWGTATNDIWAVGGAVENQSTGGVVWHFDGADWTVQDLSAVRDAGIPTLYKVWGRSASDVYAVGRLGVILHFDGERWTQVVSNSVRPIITIHGNANNVVAVGGFFIDAVILELEGEQFTDRTPRGLPQMNGVFVPEDGEAVAVGREGSLALRGASTWEPRDTTLNTLNDLHTVWIDPEGGIWAVGGDVSVDLDDGLLAYGGRRVISSELVGTCARGGTSGIPATVSYQRDIGPLLTASGCTSAPCHGGLFLSSNFDLSSYSTSFQPGDQASAFGICPIVPGNPATSYLIEKLGPTPREGVRMPNGFPPLSEAQIELISTWILEGAQNN